MQTSNPKDSDNYSVFVVNYYPKTAGTEWKADTNRISPHTDETLVTLLFTSPGEWRSEPAHSSLRGSLEIGHLCAIIVGLTGGGECRMTQHGEGVLHKGLAVLKDG